MNYYDKYYKYKIKYQNLIQIGASPYGRGNKHHNSKSTQIIQELTQPKQDSHQSQFSPLFDNDIYQKHNRTLEKTINPFELLIKKFHERNEIINKNNNNNIIINCFNYYNKIIILNSIELLINQFKEEIDNIYLHIQKNIKNINWFNLSGIGDIDNQKIIYSIREYIVCIIFLTAYKINDILYAIDVKQIELIKGLMRESKKELLIGQYFSIEISGSKLISSDIDVNIYALGNSSFWMSIIEDLVELIPWFNHTMWRVDFYGDIFKEIDQLGQCQYPNLKYNIQNTKSILLQEACISFFKNSEIIFESSEIKNNIKNLINLIDIFHKFNKSTFDDNILIQAYEKSLSINEKIKEDHAYRKSRIEDHSLQPKKDNMRERYYNKLKEIDDVIIKIKNPNIELCNSIDEFAIKIAKANHYREENYLVIDTILHIVTCIQSNLPQNKIKCNDFFCLYDPCNLDPTSYIYSIIEQYGFLIHSIGKDKCNLTANKYYNRILNGFEKIINQLVENDKITNIKELLIKNIDESNKISCLKNIRSNSNDVETTNCKTYNVDRFILDTNNKPKDLCENIYINKIPTEINILDNINILKKVRHLINKFIKCELVMKIKD